MISTCECANCGQKMEWDPSECEPGTETQCPTCNAAVSLGERKKEPKPNAFDPKKNVVDLKPQAQTTPAPMQDTVFTVVMWGVGALFLLVIVFAFCVGVVGSDPRSGGPAAVLFSLPGIAIVATILLPWLMLPIFLIRSMNRQERLLAEIRDKR